MIRKKITAFILVLLSILSLATTAFAISDELNEKLKTLSEQERNFLLMYFDEDELLVVSATRSLKSISRVAENIEVVTAADIELMNAHTVADVLVNVTGIEMWDYAGPGANGWASIHGSGYNKVAVLLDGVPLANEAQAVTLGLLPVQMIDRIEVIKGPASSSWGSSFGGVINIITKSAASGDHAGGSLYASDGKKGTSDLRAEFNGRKDNIGVYLYAGALNSGGIVDRHDFWHNNLFTKVTLDAGQKTKIDLSFFYHKDDTVPWDYTAIGYDIYHGVADENFYGRAAISTALSRDVSLNVAAWTYVQNDTVYEFTGAGSRLWDVDEHFNKYGISGSLTWKAGEHTVVAGTDIYEGRYKWSSMPDDTLTQWKYAFFVNDTISLGDVSVTPGFRYDDSNIGGSFLSPSLGTTWLASKDLLFRASLSRGFNDPRITDYYDSLDFKGNPGIKPEKIWSYQVGAEANVLNAFRAKLTLFVHDIDDIILDGEWNGLLTRGNGGKARATGGEVEIATKKYESFTFKTGFHYERIKLLNYTSDSIFDVTNSYGFNASLAYDGNGIRGILQGHYMWWDLPVDFWGSSYKGFMMDFNIIKEISKTKTTRLETFLTAHNILNEASYNDYFIVSPKRWFEAGIRYSF